MNENANPKGAYILILVASAVVVLLTFAGWIEFEYSDDVKEMYADCPECLNNTTLREFCNTIDNTSLTKPPECTHLGWCTLIEKMERGQR